MDMEDGAARGGARGVRFFRPMVPPRTTHNDLEVRYRSKGGRRVPYVGKTDELRRAEAAWASRLAKLAPERPLSGPLAAEMRICWPTEGRHAQGEPMTDRPDLDNVEKTLWDVLVRLGFIEDDRLVCDKRVAKMWSDPPGLYLRIEEIGGRWR